MQKNSVLKKVISTHWFILKLAWAANKKRVLLEFLKSLIHYADWLIIDCIVLQLIISVAEHTLSFNKVMLVVWGFIFLSILFSLFSDYYSELAKPVTDVIFFEKLNQKLYEKSCNVDLKCFENTEFYNEYMMSIKQADTKIPSALNNIFSVVCGLFAAAAAFFLVFRIDHAAILFIIFPILGNFVFSGLLNKRIFKRDRESIIYQRIADYVNRTIHLSDYAKEIRLSNVFRLMRKKYDDSVTSTHKVIKRYAFINVILFWLFQYFTFTLLFEGSMMYAGYRVLVTGSMTFAEMAVFQSVMHANTWILLYFSNDVMACVKDSLYIEQIQNFLEYVPAIPEDQDGMIPDKKIHSIKFSHVWFQYQDEKYILKDIDFEISEKQTTALVGFNGAGKSTLIKLLLRLYDPDKGEILVNGINIKKYNLLEYRKLFSSAFQDGKIFADTIKENVLMGHHTTPENDDKIVEQSLKLAGILDDINMLPLRFDTILTREFSKDGLVLSGGQNQKIIAARAFAKDCSIAVFDEPSSALDPIAEYHLFNNITKFSSDKILFFISHRLSSVQNADIIFYMENGRILERGTHLGLMNKNAKYAELYKIQAKNYQAADEDDEDYTKSIFNKHLENNTITYKGGSNYETADI